MGWNVGNGRGLPGKREWADVGGSDWERRGENGGDGGEVWNKELIPSSLRIENFLIKEFFFLEVRYFNSLMN